MTDKLEFTKSYLALRDSVVAEVTERDVVRVAGPDARSYLQGQCSQDLTGLVVGEAAEALLLTPQGKLEAYVRVVLIGEDELLVEVESGFGQTVFERLRRFKLRVKAELSLEHWHVVAIRGPQSGAALEASGPAQAIAIPVNWPGLSGMDLLAGEAVLPEGIPLGDHDAFEAARIEAGMPLMGRELTERTIAQEAGIVGRTVSFTKGCFTGQELVARIDARGGRVPRRLQGLVLVGAERGSIEAGDRLEGESGELGEVTSVGFSPTAEAPVALAYVRREVELPSDLVVVHGAARVGANVRALPLYPL